jgi:hypothetical protein
MRTRLALLVPALLLLALALPKGYAEPRPTWNLAARVPASAVAYVAAEDLDQLQARADQTAIGRLINDPAMQAFVAPLKTAFNEMVALPPDLPPSLKDLVQLVKSLRGQVALAFLGMDPKGGPAIVASVDFGARTGEFGPLLGRLANELAGDDVKVGMSTKDGRPWWTIAIRRGPTLHATIVDTAFVVATTPDLLANVVGAPADTGTLATSSEFQGVLGRIGREGLAVLAYANVPAALAAFGEAFPPEVRPMVEAMGLDTIRAVAYAMSFAGDGFRDTFLVHAPKADHGIIPAIQLAPIDRPRFLGLAPANAFAYGEMNLSLERYWAALKSIMQTMEPRAVVEIEKGLAQVDAQLGVSVERELLGGLGGTLGWYASMSQGGGLFPELALMATVKDPAAYEQVLTRFAEGIAGIVNEDGRVIVRKRTMEFEGQRLHLVELQMARGDDVVPFTPSWALLGDRLIVTLVPYTLKEIVWRAKNAQAAGPGLDAQEDFKALYALKPASAGYVGYFDLQAVLALLYDTGVPLLQTLVKPNLYQEVAGKLPVDFAALPPARVIRPYLRSMMSFESWDEDGIEVRMHGPIPLMPVLFGVGIGAAVAMPMAMRRARFEPEIEVRMPDDVVAPEDPLTQAQSDIRSLTSYVNLYLLEEQALPATLDDLVKKSFLEVLPNDPWDNAYRLVVSDAKARAFQVVSNGPDGRPGTPDDVTLASAVR